MNKMKEKVKEVALVGLSPVGIVTLELLARYGLSVRVLDRGRVEEEDIKNSTLFIEEDITKFKVKEAKKRLSKVNPKIKIKSFHEEISKNNVFLVKSNVCIDTSNITDINEITVPYCLKNKIPVVVLKITKKNIEILILNKKISKKNMETFMKRKDEEIEYDPSIITASTFVISSAVMNILSGNKKSFLIKINPMTIRTQIKSL